MDQESTCDDYIIRKNELIVKNCSGSDMLSLIVCFNFLLCTDLSFVNSDIQDSDVQRFVGINNVDCLHLNNCNNITDQGFKRLVQITKPKEIAVLNCPHIISHHIEGYTNIITIPVPKPSSHFNAPTTQCANKGKKSL